MPAAQGCPSAGGRTAPGIGKFCVQKMKTKSPPPNSSPRRQMAEQCLGAIPRTYYTVGMATLRKKRRWVVGRVYLAIPASPHQLFMLSLRNRELHVKKGLSQLIARAGGIKHKWRLTRRAPPCCEATGSAIRPTNPSRHRADPCTSHPLQATLTEPLLLACPSGHSFGTPLGNFSCLIPW